MTGPGRSARRMRVAQRGRKGNVTLRQTSARFSHLLLTPSPALSSPEHPLQIRAPSCVWAVPRGLSTQHLVCSHTPWKTAAGLLP